VYIACLIVLPLLRWEAGKQRWRRFRRKPPPRPAVTATYNHLTRNSNQDTHINLQCNHPYRVICTVGDRCRPQVTLPLRKRLIGAPRVFGAPLRLRLPPTPLPILHTLILVEDCFVAHSAPQPRRTTGSPGMATRSIETRCRKTAHSLVQSTWFVDNML
jgi:hypothetical protein